MGTRALIPVLVYVCRSKGLTQHSTGRKETSWPMLVQIGLWRYVAANKRKVFNARLGMCCVDYNVFITPPSPPASLCLPRCLLSLYGDGLYAW